jgi:hypothetical protein
MCTGTLCIHGQLNATLNSPTSAPDAMMPARNSAAVCFHARSTWGPKRARRKRRAVA